MLSGYRYNLPKELIANAPAEPRDSARLLVYSTASDEVFFDIFANIARYVPERSVLVLNDTRVVPARISLSKITGGHVRMLFLINEWDGGSIIKGLPDRHIVVGESLFLGHRAFVEVVGQKDEEFSFKLLVSADEFRKSFELHGQTPLPPYIHSEMDENKRRESYQTVFAKKEGSVAAPTASLHFTDRVFLSLAEKMVEKAHITLQVGRGTFSPVGEKEMNKGELHTEPISIDQESATVIAKAKSEGRTVVAAGTTAVRAVESAAPQILSGTGYVGSTSLFIKPPYDFKVVDAMITNFHLPDTSLIVLVDAFMRFKKSKRSWIDIYNIAIKEKMRFYSFGDAMMVI